MKSAILLLFVVLFGQVCIAQNSDIQILKKNLIHDALQNKGFQPRIERYITPNYSKTKEYLKSLNKNGAWEDIDYTDRDNNWDPLHHLNRVLIMSYNYCHSASEFYRNKKLLNGLERAINYWYTVNPECDNWYKNRIAKQFYFNVIALLLQGKIDSLLETKMINDLTETPTMTGSNRTLLATSTFYRGVLTNNSEMIKLGVTGVTDQIIISTKEGVQPDYSFHQHGHFIYNGSYGLNFLRESVWLATIVHTTKYAFSDDYIKILRDYFLNGTRWMIRGGLIDYNVRGRQVGRGDGIILYGNLLIPVLQHLIIADPAFQNEYKTSIENIKNETPQNVRGLKHFWRSDYSIVQRDNYTISLKMCSERTVGIELNMNSENKLGYWLPYGLTYFYRTGREYDGIFPVWDWTKLPGVTNPHLLIEEKRKGKAHTQQTNFVGGISNGIYGFSAMDFSKNKTTAKKSWFWFDNEMVALGAGISSEHDSSITSTINQTMLRGKVEINQGGTTSIFNNQNQSIKNPNWVLHDSIAYVFPENTQLEISAKIQSGNLQRIYGLGKDTVFSKPVFTLWFNHHKKPQNASYQYIVVPQTNKKAVNNYLKNLPVYVLLNQPEIQAVYQKNLQLYGIVFYKKGEFEYKNLQINVEHPCLLLLDEKNTKLYVSDPTTKLSEIKIQIKRNGTTVVDTIVELPRDEFAGQTTAIQLKNLQ